MVDQDPIDVFSEWLDETADLQIKANKIMRTGPHRDDIDDVDDDGKSIGNRHGTADREEDNPDENDDDLLNEFDEEVD